MVRYLSRGGVNFLLSGNDVHRKHLSSFEGTNVCIECRLQTICHSQSFGEQLVRFHIKEEWNKRQHMNQNANVNGIKKLQVVAPFSFAKKMPTDLNCPSAVTRAGAGGCGFSHQIDSQSVNCVEAKICTSKSV